MKNKLKKFYENHTKKKIAVTLLLLFFFIGAGGFFTYQSLNTSNDKIVVGSVKNASNTKKESSQEENKNQESSESTDETTSEDTQETSGEGAQRSQSVTGHASTPSSNAAVSNGGATSATSGGHVHNYVPVYQDVPAEGYWQFVPGQTVTETWVVFSNGVEMRFVTDEEARKAEDYSAYNGLHFSEFQKVISQTPAQEVWVETKPAQTILVGYQCTIDGSWK